MQTEVARGLLKGLRNSTFNGERFGSGIESFGISSLNRPDSCTDAGTCRFGEVRVQLISGTDIRQTAYWVRQAPRFASRLGR
jgi:hypothetical protein